MITRAAWSRLSQRIGRSQGFEAAVIAVDTLVRVLRGVVECGWQRFSIAARSTGTLSVLGREPVAFEYG
jgi:hypothetical protein